MLGSAPHTGQATYLTRLGICPPIGVWLNGGLGVP